MRCQLTNLVRINGEYTSITFKLHIQNRRDVCEIFPSEVTVLSTRTQKRPAQTLKLTLTSLYTARGPLDAGARKRRLN